MILIDCTRHVHALGRLLGVADGVLTFDAPANIVSSSGSYAMNHPVVLITGALTGVGRAAALAFARNRARLVVSDRRDNAGEALVAELRAFGAVTP
jgi:hypothetical protein